MLVLFIDMVQLLFTKENRSMITENMLSILNHLIFIFDLIYINTKFPIHYFLYLKFYKYYS